MIVGVSTASPPPEVKRTQVGALALGVEISGLQGDRHLFAGPKHADQHRRENRKAPAQGGLQR